jgi:hypothetical protein
VLPSAAKPRVMEILNLVVTILDLGPAPRLIRKKKRAQSACDESGECCWVC